MKRNTKKQGFTLIEIMIVVLIIGILLAIAVPNFIRARASSRLKSVIANLTQIDAAAQQYAMEANLTNGTVIAQNKLDGTGGSTSYLTWPTGPVTGTYAVGALNGTANGLTATFNGGTKGAMDATAWQTTCSADPATCGL